MERTKSDSTGGELIVVRQLPVIEEQLWTLKDRWEQRATDAESMVCTEETIQAVKAFRSETRKEFDKVEAMRKATKQAVMEPYNRFEAVYKECITTAFYRVDNACSSKVSEVEADMKRRCEDGLRDYFSELCAVHHLDWLTYEQAGIKVDMASAKAKTPKRLREQLAAFIKDISENVSVISGMENADEMMVEYQNCLNFADAYNSVQKRNRNIEDQKSARESREAVQEQEAEMVRRVEALAPPVAVSATEEKTIMVQLILHPTKSQFEEKIKPIMKHLKEICDMEGIKYE